MRRTRRTITLAVITLAFLGCTSANATPTDKPSAVAASVASATPGAATLTIAYEENCQVELIAPSGLRILIDVADPTLLTSPARASDILLTTHMHSDHYNADFEASFPGRKITNETTDLAVGDTRIRSIAASHDDTSINADSPTNHVFVIEFDGFRIVHGGSTGQLKLTPDQLAAVGANVDIGALVLMNVGGFDPTGTKAIDIVKQVKPKILLPTHKSLDYVQAAGRNWKSAYASNPTVTISRDQLPAETTMLFMGRMATSYGTILHAPETSW